MTPRVVAILAGVSGLIVGGGSGCGTTSEVTKTVTVTTPSQTGSTAEKAKQKRKPAKRNPRAPTAGTRFRACDRNITAKIGTTSCPFAQNVFWAYFWDTQGDGDGNVRAYSPITARYYEMSCSTGTSVTCRAGDGAVVRFPTTAVRAYDTAQADQYEATHDTGPSSEAPTPRQAPEPSPEDDCDPNYSGACLDPNSADYDCEGGSGDGPDYTGLVEVTGEDHFGLDRDGNGVGCE